MNMESQYHLYMERTDISNIDAKRLLRRICKAISKSCGTTVTPNYYSNGMTNIVSNDDREVVAFKVVDKKEHIMFFCSAEALIETMTMPSTILHFSPLGKDKVEINTSKMFGTTIEEINVKLDLLKV